MPVNYFSKAFCSLLSPKNAVCYFTLLPLMVFSSEKKDFDTSFIYQPYGNQITNDISILNKNDIQLIPGTYLMDVYVNNKRVDKDYIKLELRAKDDNLSPCENSLKYSQWGIITNKNSDNLASNNTENCYDITRFIPQSTTKIDAEKMRVVISVPQLYINRDLHDKIPSRLWNEGINAGYVNYQFSGQANSSGDDDTTQMGSLGLQAGVNIGSWHFRNESNYSITNQKRATFSSNRTFLQHDIKSLRSQLYIGDVYSDGLLFDSLRIRGFSLKTDDSMLPDNLRGYAPVIRGIANSNAVVEIRQNGFLLYTMNVPPGPFIIDDLNPSGSNGELIITVIESNGERRVTTQAFSSLPLMIRKDQAKFSLEGGKLKRYGTSKKEFNIVNTSVLYGLFDNYSIAGGTQFTEGFNAINLGVGANTEYGAFSVDLTRSKSVSTHQDDVGKSLRFLYSKTLGITMTNFTLAAYRYSTSGYRTLTDHVGSYEKSDKSINNKISKSRLDVSISQHLETKSYDLGTLFLSGSYIDYWESHDNNKNFQVGYGNTLFNKINYNISISREKTQFGTKSVSTENRLALTLSIPLGTDLSSTRLNYYGSNSSVNGSTNLIGINGLVRNVQGLNWDTQFGNDSTGHSLGSGNLNYEGSTGNFSAGYNQGHNYKSLNAGASGSLVVHSGGINVGRQVGETFGLVEIKGAPNVQLSSGNNIYTGSNGYAIIPSLNPYRINTVGIDDSAVLSDGLDLIDPMQQIIPSRGSITRVKIDSRSGQRVQVRILNENNKPVQFGTQIYDIDNNLLGITDPYGKSLILVKKEHGTLLIEENGKTYKKEFTVGRKKKNTNFTFLEIHIHNKDPR